MAHHFRQLRAARGFTLMEMLIVIAIIGLLAGLIIAGVSHARVNARTSAARLQIAGISTALESYAQTFNGYYPPSYPVPANNTYAFTSPGLINNVAPASVGAQMLAEALVGWMPGAIGTTPGDGAGSGSGDTNEFGFRNKGSGATAVGTVYGPYITPTNTNYDAVNHVLVDINRQPIYYYRRVAPLVNGVPRTVTFAFSSPTQSSWTAGNYTAGSPDGSATFTACFVGMDNPGQPDGSGPFLKLLGVQSGNNQLQAGDAILQKNYLLVAPGEDQTFFTPNANGAVDDVVNDVR